MRKVLRIGTPVLLNLTSVFTEPLPKGPVILHMTEDEWEKLSRGIEVSKKRIPMRAKGLFVIPDPFGGYLGFLACAAGSGQGVACVPEVVRLGGTITFGAGCRCIRGKDTVDPPPSPGKEACSLAITRRGLTCVGTCETGKNCVLIKVLGSGRTFISCQCF